MHALVIYRLCIAIFIMKEVLYGIGPHITSDVKEFCRTCDVCQNLGKGGPSAVAPLHSLPLVTEPFCQVAIDIKLVPGPSRATAGPGKTLSRGPITPSFCMS